MNFALLICILAAILFIVVGLRAKEGRDFWGGRYGPAVMGAALAASYTGGGAIFGISGLAQRHGYWALIDSLASAAGLFLTAFLAYRGFFGKSFARDFFHPESRIRNKNYLRMNNVSIATLYIMVIAAQYRAAINLGDYFNFQWSGVSFAAFCAAVVAVYSVRGFAATTRTDVLQIALMAPLYLILLMAAFGDLDLGAAPEPALGQQTSMPWSVFLTLCLPFIFIPMSQELMQRNASATNSDEIWRSNALAALIVLSFGIALVSSFSLVPSLSIPRLLNAPGVIVPALVAVGVMAALLSTMDTAANIAAKSLGSIPGLERISPWGRTVIALLAAVPALYFGSTVLSFIYAAIFIYLAGPALGFLALTRRLSPRQATAISSVFVSLQVGLAWDNAQTQFLRQFFSISSNDITLLGLSLVVVQAAVVLLLPWCWNERR